MPRPAIPDKIPCSSASQWNARVQAAMEVIGPAETEDNWDAMERMFQTLSSVVRGGAYELEQDFVLGMRTMSRAVTEAMSSDRLRLLGAAIDFLSVTGNLSGLKFEPLLPLYLPTVLKLCTRTSKIIVSRAQQCLKMFASRCPAPFLPVHFKASLNEKSTSLRLAIAEAVTVLFETCIKDGVNKLQRTVADLEFIVKTLARDSSPETRKVARSAFALYSQIWPDRIGDFLQPLSPTTRRYLDVNDKPSASGHARTDSTARQRVKSAPSTPQLARKKSAPVLRAQPAAFVSKTTEPLKHEPLPSQPKLRRAISTHFRSQAASTAVTHSTAVNHPIPSKTSHAAHAPLHPMPPRPKSVAGHRREQSSDDTTRHRVLRGAPSYRELPSRPQSAMSKRSESEKSATSVPVSNQQHGQRQETTRPAHRHTPSEMDQRTLRKLESVPLAGGPKEVRATTTTNTYGQPFKPRRDPERVPPTNKKTSGFGAPALISLSSSHSQTKPASHGSSAVLPRADAAKKVTPPLQTNTSRFAIPFPGAAKDTIKSLPIAASQVPLPPSPSSSTSTKPLVSHHVKNHAPTVTSDEAQRARVESLRKSRSVSSRGPQTAPASLQQSAASQASAMTVSSSATDVSHRERRAGVAAPTQSQLSKQKPSVHKNGFRPVSKLRGAKSTVNLKAKSGSSASGLPTALLAARGIGPPSTAEVEVAARVPLPSSPTTSTRTQTDRNEVSAQGNSSSAHRNVVTHSAAEHNHRTEAISHADLAERLLPPTLTLESVQQRLSDVLHGRDSAPSPLLVQPGGAQHLSPSFANEEFTLSELVPSSGEHNLSPASSPGKLVISEVKGARTALRHVENSSMR